MLSFIIAVVILILLALLFFVPALLKPKLLAADTFDQQNIQIAKERLAELKEDLEKGVIDQQGYEQAREELEKNLAMDLSVSQPAEQTEAQPAKGLAITLVVAVPLLAVLIYSQLGRYDSIDGTLQEQQQRVSSEDGAPKMSIEEAITKLEQRLQQEPNNPEGWFMLARTYAAMNQYARAIPAYEKTIELVPDNADLLLSYADALAMNEGGRMSGKARPVIQKAVQIAPEHMQGLWMAGMLSNELGEYKQALSYWYRLDPMLNNDVASQAQLREMMASVEKNLSPDDVKQIRQASNSVKTENAVKVAITVNVSLDAALNDRISEGDTLFIFARAMEGPPMPLAAVRHPVNMLPLTVELNDAMAMMPAMKLSNFEKVKVAAIVSKSGQAGLKEGDLFGEINSVAVTSKDAINLVINQIK